MDASSGKRDWWQRVRDLTQEPLWNVHEKGEDGAAEEEEEFGGETEAEDVEEGAERRMRSLLSMRGAFGWLSSRIGQNLNHAMLDLQVR